MSNDLIKNDNPADVLAVIIETGPEILMANQERLTKVQTAVALALADIASEGMSDEMDDYLNRVQVRMKEVLNEMNDERKGLTQSLDKIKKAFTELEAPLDPSKPDSLFNQIGAHRKEYARQVAEERKRREEEARRRQEIKNELDSMETIAKLQIRQGFTDDLFDAKNHMLECFESATLENFDEVEHKIHNWHMQYNKLDHDSIKVSIRAIYHSPEKVTEIIENTKSGTFDAYKIEYETEMNAMRRQIFDQLSGKKQQLEIEAENKRQAELARLEQEAAAKRAMEAKNEEDRIRAQKEQAEAAKREEQRRIEQERLEEERRKRDEENRAAEARKQKEAEEKAKADAEAEKAIKAADTLFQTEMDLAEPESKNKAKETYVIEVKHAQGWLPIVSFYFQNKGAKEDPEGLGKKTLNNMRKFAEDAYNKDGVKIDTPLIVYIADYKVQARK